MKLVVGQAVYRAGIVPTRGGYLPRVETLKVVGSDEGSDVNRYRFQFENGFIISAEVVPGSKIYDVFVRRDKAMVMAEKMVKVCEKGVKS